VTQTTEEPKGNVPEAKAPASQAPDVYTQDYRHFDNLIWQVPAWSTAVFALSVTATVLALANATAIGSKLSVDVYHAAALFQGVVLGILLLFTNVYLRLRLHQRVVNRPQRRHVPSPWFLVPGQTALLGVLVLESATILCFALGLAGLHPNSAAIAATAVFLPGFAYVELTVRRLAASIRAVSAAQPTAGEA
jgi:hypothetical protein